MTLDSREDTHLNDMYSGIRSRSATWGGLYNSNSNSNSSSSRKIAVEPCRAYLIRAMKMTIVNDED